MNRVFAGELMQCVLCGRQRQATPNTDWRAIEADGVMYYACPDEFPPDGAGTAEEYAECYRGVIAAITITRNTSYRYAMEVPEIAAAVGHLRRVIAELPGDGSVIPSPRRGLS